MKRILFLLAFIAATSHYTHAEYSPDQCASIKQKREAIRVRMRDKTYTIKEGEQLEEKSSRLLAEYKRNCVNHEEGEGLYTVVGAKQTEFVNPFTNHRMTGASSYAFFYNDSEKQSAWQKFYKFHPSCRTKNASNADFVKCTEDKANQRELFEQTWNKAFNRYQLQLAEQAAVEQTSKKHVGGAAHVKANQPANHESKLQVTSGENKQAFAKAENTLSNFTQITTIAFIILLVLGVYTWLLLKHVKRN